MSSQPPSDALRMTLDYYERNAEEFERRTRDIDLSPLYDEFLPLVPPGGHILDAGCGTGRDSEAFLKRGFRVTAFDASEAMVRMATGRIGQRVLRLAFEQLELKQEMDGAWACASLLHLPKNRMGLVFQRLHEALVPGGVLFASFKHGLGEEFRDGRFFNDYDEGSLARFLQPLPDWTLLKLWRTNDIGQWRAGVEWVNVLARAR